MIEMSFEASKQFCIECTQDSVVTLINSALCRLKCYETRSKSVHLTDIAFHSIKSGSEVITGGISTKCILIVSGTGKIKTMPIMSGLFLIYDEQLTITADADLMFYEGSVEFL